ncbi:MAG: ClpXP protease specificity-enhancing factor SspB [Caulobacterales bacterium]
MGIVMAEDLMGYERMAQEALRDVLRMALMRAASPAGLPGKHHFYITFKTQARGVVIAQRLIERYPEEMTIVLEHQFWDLKVDAQGFEVSLKFSGIPERLVVPFRAVTRFVDPHSRFGLNFEPPVEEEDVTHVVLPPRAAVGGAQAQAAEDAPQSPPASVVSLDAFRKK